MASPESSADPEAARNPSAPPSQGEIAPTEWRIFLESTPPDAEVLVRGAFRTWSPAGGGGTQIVPARPDTIRLYCGAKVCDGERFFDIEKSESGPAISGLALRLLKYQCRNCKTHEKLYAVLLQTPDAQDTALRSVALKVAEFPPFGLRVPRRVLDLLGDDRELFLKGRSAENRGLGIGAFTYYRRVLDNQKSRIVEGIIKVAKRVGATPAVLSQLEQARTAWRFDQSVDQIKGAIPDSLKVSGHNPLVLLHDALSEGIHELSDQECLERATAVRLVLTELAERIDRALEQKAELDQAVSALLLRREAQEREKAEGGSNPTE